MKAIAAIAAAVFLALAASAHAGEGSFVGASGHETSGTVSVQEDGGMIVIELHDSFSLDGAPDPYVALGTGSKPIEGGLIEKLRENTGGQRYSAEATDALKNADEVVIWCKRFSVPLGVAKIE
ncbi:MAG: DM13 domain-containing protein [Rhodovibrionaceae bacterium]|nr:DM13 domain-containing protein [Rhodovibrionaceae bacterium]